MQVHITNLATGVNFSIDQIEPSDTDDELKFRIQEFIGIPHDQQSIIFAGKELKDGNTLSDYNIKDGSRLHLIFRTE